jgi:putative thiamine transport system ATP-binding protein
MLAIRHLTLRLGPQPLFTDFSLSVPAGQVVTLMGPSGSGKSTLLQWMVGALEPAFVAQGELWLGGRALHTLPTEQRRLGLLFQDDVLFPHLSVGQNLAFALPASVRGAAARRETVAQALASVELAGFDQRDPATLSGGQRARASLMRTLLAQPQALLLDEPFAKLDVALRQRFRALVFAHVAERGIPTLLVTHDPADVPAGGQVVTLADQADGEDHPEATSHA